MPMYRGSQLRILFSNPLVRPKFQPILIVAGDPLHPHAIAAYPGGALFLSPEPFSICTGPLVA